MVELNDRVLMVGNSFVVQRTGQERASLQTESVGANKDTESSKTGNAGKNAHDRVGNVGVKSE